MSEKRVRTVTKVLFVDDTQAQLDTWARECRREGKIPLRAKNLDEALAIARNERPHLAIVDFFVPEPVGPRIIQELKDQDDKMFVIAVSGYMAVDHAMQCVHAGADDCYLKPISCRQLISRAELGTRPAPQRNQTPTLAQVEWEQIVRVLNDCGGNITHAARALGTHRQSLQRKIDKHRPKSPRTGPVPRTRRAWLLSAEERHQLNNAQQFMLEAFATSNPAERLEIAETALLVSADCVDAYVVLAEAAPDLAAAIELTRKAVEIAERLLGATAVDRLIGDFWTIAETRPYMRARRALAQCLWDAGQHDEAIAHYRELLRLNPDDHQGIRYTLAACLAQCGRADEVCDLVDAHGDDLGAPRTRPRPRNEGA